MTHQPHVCITDRSQSYKAVGFFFWPTTIHMTTPQATQSQQTNLNHTQRHEVQYTPRQLNNRV